MDKAKATVGFTTAGAPMPRLSLDMIHEKSPAVCQSCGVRATMVLSHRWQEHNEADRPEPVVVVLCAKCSDRLVESHPRLYRRLDLFEPWPGCMDLCVDCRFRNGTRCGHPEAKINGGAGVLLTMPKPTQAHIKRSPRRLSGWYTFWTGPVVSCKQKELAAGASPAAPEASKEECDHA